MTHASNPLLEDWATPFGLPPFDRIRAEHFPPAFDDAMARHLAEVAAIARSPGPPTFANTVEALERSGRLLARVTQVFGNLTDSASDEALSAVERDYSPRLTGHQMTVALDPDLFARVDDLYARRDTLGLDTAQLRLLERLHLNFVRSGARLEPPAKARMAALSERLATLQTQFGQNVLHDESQWQLVLDAGDLDGLPTFARAAAAGAARQRGMDGGHVITLSRSAVEPFLTFSIRRDLRRIVYEAWMRRGGNPGAWDNTALIGEILTLRAEQARLMGYATYADYKLADTMAGDTAAVDGLLRQVWEPARRKAMAERAELLALAQADGLNDALAPWDWHYYAEKRRHARYTIDEAEVKPYFELSAIVQAAFDVATRLFGVTFAERTGLPVYHPDVRVYEVLDTGGHHVGLFMHDNFARAGKRSGAWMGSFRDQDDLDGPVAPIIVNNNNLARGEPTLLSFDDAETLFHEFGHGLHGLLSRVRYPSQSGTSVRRDFVEFPSQVYEHWLAAPETLRRYARHVDTGQPMPEDLIDRLHAARNANQGFGTVSFVAAALLDMAFHTLPDPSGIDIAAFERQLLDDIGMPAEIGVRHRPVHFQHLFAGSGYAAGYYAYLWAEVLDADGFSAFEEAGDLFDPQLAARLKDIYQAGDTRDPMELYTALRGRAPDIAALLKHRGFAGEPEA
jgi:peptidyl-dipeptidase Dcp